MRRVLGLGDLLLLAAASIGPAFSLATTFGPMVAEGGSATPLALVLVTVIMVCVAIAYRRLGSRYPNAGSAYTWVHIAFGPRAGAYAAWVLIVANLFAIVATAVPAGAYTLALLAPALADRPGADGVVGACWVLGAGLLLYRGLRPTSRLANALAIAELAVLAVAAAFAAVHAPAVHAAAAAPPPGVGALIGAVAIGIWMTDGWEVSASTAEEAYHAETAPGAGGLAGLLLTAAVLWLCMSAFLRVGAKIRTAAAALSMKSTPRNTVVPVRMKSNAARTLGKNALATRPATPAAVSSTIANAGCSRASSVPKRCGNTPSRPIAKKLRVR